MQTLEMCTKTLFLLLRQVHSCSAPSAGRTRTDFTTTPETARYLHVSHDCPGPCAPGGKAITIQHQHTAGKENNSVFLFVFSLSQTSKDVRDFSHGLQAARSAQRGSACTLKRYYNASTHTHTASL